MAGTTPDPCVPGTFAPSTDTDGSGRKGPGCKGEVGNKFGGEAVRVRLSGKQVRECGELGGFSFARRGEGCAVVNWNGVRQPRCVRRSGDRSCYGVYGGVLGSKRGSVLSCSCVVKVGKEIIGQECECTRPREVVSVESA